ncbi:hypothetical protein CHS0354_009994 [Potamilus streckersoni]|uniref:Small ribosomal subunit protein mS31 n=1 Tax=Potamilus streckersoni TaxID=2493646 RepID=A0AAE0VUE1_9BIVA|nr:hypothetical protein CHS0354_009994 [Potamilus streckersoni]
MATPYRRLCCIHRLISLNSSCNSTKLNAGIRIHKCQGTRAFSASQFFLKKSNSAKVTNVISDDQRAGLDKKLVDAATSVASSLPGDKKLNESDLLQKLRAAAKLSQNQKSGDVPKSKEDTGILLKSMRIVMSNKDAEGNWKNPEKVKRPEFSNFVLARKSSHLDQPTRKRHHGESNLFGSQRLGIFSEDFKATSKQPDTGDRVSVSLFDEVEKENAELLYNIPSNYFEEQMQLTKEGKIWTFPIDNEAGWEEEKNVKFYEHVFLEKHIADFPQKGPIRHFMELVLVGLSKNPYMTVEQKKEHIHWFRDYFKQKQSTLEEGMGIPLEFKQVTLG